MSHESNVAGHYAQVIEEVERLAEAVRQGRWVEVFDVANEIKGSAYDLSDAAAEADVDDAGLGVPSGEDVIRKLERSLGGLLEHLHPIEDRAPSSL